jgi:uncharacterized metal-binding protein
MSRDPKLSEPTRQWLTGVIVTVVTIICLFALAKVSILAVIIASGATVIVGVVLSWFVGRRLRNRRRA